MQSPRTPRFILTSLAAFSLCLVCKPAAAQTAPQICPNPLGSVTLQGLAPRAPHKPLTAPVPKDAPIEVSSDQAKVGVNGDATLTGNVHVKQGDREINAQDAQYDSKSTSIAVSGSMTYRDPALVVTGTGGHYSATEGASFGEAQFQLIERGASGSAESLTLSPDGIVRLNRVRFTTCSPIDKAWELKARQITLDTKSRVGTGLDARIELKGVPILYLPWMSFPLSNDRKSGFLFPSLGHTTRSGVEFSVPYYWNIAPNADLTFDPTIYSSRGIDASGEFRFLTDSQHGIFNFHYLPHDDITNSDRSLIKFTDVIKLPADFRLTLDAENISDPGYFEDFAQGPASTSVAFVERLARLSYRDENWRLTADLQQFQTIDQDMDLADRPYARLPRLTAEGDFTWGQYNWFRYGFDSELVNFDRAAGVTGWRLDARPGVGLDFSGPGYFIRPNLAWRATSYELSNVAPSVDSSPTRTLPVASFDTGLVFERAEGSHGARTLTLEPRLLYLYTPYRNQDNLPLFDTGIPDLNLVELFRTNRYVGADRVGDANQVSVGVTSRLLDAHDGSQYLSATLGQTYYFETPRVRLPEEPQISRVTSDVVAQLSLTAYKHWNANLGVDWNPAESQSERAEVGLQYKPDGERVANIGYRFQRDSLQQLEASSAWPLNEHWKAYGRVVYSLQDHSSLDRFLGFEYGACCFKLRFIGRRYVSTRTGEKDTGIYLQLELNGLASVGSPADTFLQDEIRGYSRTSPTF